MRFTFFVSALACCAALAACTNYPAAAAGGGEGGSGPGGSGGGQGGSGGGSGGGQGGVGPGGSGGGQGGVGPGGSGGGQAGSGGGGGQDACSGPRDGGYGNCEALIGWVFVPALGHCGLVSGCGCPLDVGCPELFPDEASCNETCRVVGGGACDDVRNWPFSCGMPPPGNGGGEPPPGGGGVAPAWEEWVFTGQTCEPVYICGCDPAVDPCGALHATFEECLATCDRPPPGPCPQRQSPDECGSTPECRWLVPGCGGTPIEREGCYPAQDCGPNGECPPAYTCEARWADPCAFQSCDACGVEVFVCELVGPPPDCTGSFVDGNGLCRYPDDGVAPPECCAPYDCDQAHVTCRSLPPLCEGGFVPSVNQFACWGPCVPEGLCGELGTNERLCAGTGGSWDPFACGNAICGQPPGCDAIIPGCDCGPGRSFDPMAGCVRDPSCSGGTGGLWESCGGPGGASCATGLRCDQLDPGFPGMCVPDGSYVCGSDGDCPAGTACCYPCGIQGCNNTCLALDAGGSCPLFP